MRDAGKQGIAPQAQTAAINVAAAKDMVGELILDIGAPDRQVVARKFLAGSAFLRLVGNSQCRAHGMAQVFNVVHQRLVPRGFEIILGMQSMLPSDIDQNCIRLCERGFAGNFQDGQGTKRGLWLQCGPFRAWNAHVLEIDSCQMQGNPALFAAAPGEVKNR